MISTEDLETYLQLMKKHNVEHLEMGDVKISMKVVAPELHKSKTTLEKLDKLAAMPSQEELEMYHHNVAPNHPVFSQIDRVKKVK